MTLDFLTDGVVKFAEWSKRMVERFREAVRRHLLPLYYQAKAVARNIFSDERGSIGGEQALPARIAPYFRETTDEFRGRPKEALAWVRAREGRFARGAIPHPDFENGIRLLHGEPGDPSKKWRGGFGVSHIDAARQSENYLDEAVEVIPTLPVIETTVDRKTGRVLGKVLSDGSRRAVVSLDLKGYPTPEWLLTTYERPASVTSGGVHGASEGAGPTPPATDRTSIIGRKTAFEKPPEYQSAVARGAALLREGVTRFADWSRRMLAEFGERIRP